jgi:hypothetical protein
VKTVTNLVGYETSENLRALWRIAQRQSVICTAADLGEPHSEESRLVCRTVAALGDDQVVVQVVAEGGTCYALGDTETRFVDSARKAGVRWIPPGCGTSQPCPNCWDVLQPGETLCEECRNEGAGGEAWVSATGLGEEGRNTEGE